MSNFLYFSRLPAGLCHSEATIAATRAGYVGIVNAEQATNQQATNEQRIFRDLSQVARTARSAFGLALDTLAPEFRRAIVDLAGKSELSYLFLPARVARAHAAFLQDVRHSGIRLVVEVIQGQVPEGVGENDVDAWLLKGHEAGGFVGEESSFILMQKWRSLTARPLYLHGGMTPQTVAACRLAGAQGALFEGQTLLLDDVGLDRTVRDQVHKLSGSETVAVGDPELGEYFRLLVRPTLRAAQVFVARAQGKGHEEMQSLLQGRSDEDRSLDAAGSLLPLGQDVGFAADYAKRHGSYRQLLVACERAWSETIDLYRKKAPLGVESPLCHELGTALPVVQGPMTRVSDRPEFAAAVADQGGLPMIACALLRGRQLEEILERTVALLGERPWGIGLLGFAPGPLLAEQLTIALRYRPAFAIVAGGRPDQIVELEASKIRSFLHVPSRNLIPLFLQEGARRFIFEGRECGGHVGPLSSFVLWSSMVDELCAQLDEPSAPPAGEISVLLAGGIHDATSSAMVQMLAAPLVSRGVRIGLLMGSAYLFTEEIVASGAIVPTFQSEVIACRHTVNLESGPGHASRCGLTPFAREFFSKRRALKAAGTPADQLRKALDDLILGRLRIASKGTKRNDAGNLVALEPEEQKVEGMYMLGQVATLRDTVTSVRALHDEVTQGASLILDEILQRASSHANDSEADPHLAPCDVAVIGMATLLPGANDLDTYWENILDKVDAITEIPSHRWDFRLYFDEDRKTRDKIYSKWGGFLSDVAFDPTRFGMPPRSVPAVDPMQLIALEVAARSLADAGYDRRPFDRTRASVIVGASGGTGDVGTQYGLRAELPRFLGHLPQEVAAHLPEWTEDSFAGILNNVVAGRIANRLDLGGGNFTTDAACASSLASLYQAVSELAAGRTDLVIAGGVDTVQGPFGYLCFSKTQALSPRGKCSSFDAGADGIVISEGVAMVVCKRLADAERDGDRIYAVIKGMGASSDGRARGMTAPLPAGQLRAMRRAYAQAGYAPHTVGLFEAHGTGTVAGDTAELESTTTLVRESRAAAGSPARNPTAARAVVGSVKTMIGHTKATAGMAGFVKAVLALHHRVLPPHANVSEPNPVLRAADSPLVLLGEALPWLSSPEHPRRAAVSAFGFGGTNFHVTAEEYQGEYRARLRAAPRKHWPRELFVYKAADRTSLATALSNDLKRFRDRFAPERWTLREVAATVCEDLAEGQVTLALLAQDLPQWEQSVTQALAYLEGRRIELPKDTYFSEQGPEHLCAGGKVAFLFSGQGCQYPGMARNLALHIDGCRETIEEAEQLLSERFEHRHKKSLSDFLWPEPWYFTDSTSASERLKSTDVAQPALGAVDTALFRLMSRLGVQADMLAGHSFGEFVALHAAGALSFADLLEVAEARGRFIVDAAQANGIELGTMAAAQASRDVVDEVLSSVLDVVLANHNAPQQCIISGTLAAVEASMHQLEARGIPTTILPVAAAFHSPLVRPAQDRLAEVIQQAAWRNIELPVYSNTTGQPHESDVGAMKRRMIEHLVCPVEFVKQIETMHDDGARIFVELGPKAVLTGLTSQILSNRPHLALATDSRDGISGLLTALARLTCAGVHLDLAPLFAGRVPERGARGQGQAPDAARTWLLNGSGARPFSQPQKRVGVSLEESEAARMRPFDPGPPTQEPGLPIEFAPSPSSTIFTEQVMHDDDEFFEPPGDQATALAYFATMRQFLKTQERVMAMLTRSASYPLEQPQEDGSNRRRPTTPSVAIPAALRGLRAEETQPSRGAIAPPAPASRTATPTPLAVAPPEPSPPPDAKPKPIAATKTTSEAEIDLAALGDLLLGVVEDKTGYPKDMVGLGQNLEAELGIDSIKRVEVVAAMLQLLPESWRSQLVERRTELNTQTTLQGIVDILSEARKKTTNGEPPHKNGFPEGARPFDLAGVGEVAQAGSLPRYVLVAEKEPIPETTERAVPAGHYVLCGDALGVADALEVLLLEAGCSVTRLELEALDGEEALLQEIAEIQSERSAIAGVLHLTAVGRSPLDPGAEQLTWRRELFLNEQSLFLLLQAFDAKWTENPRLLCATSLGGSFGRRACEPTPPVEPDTQPAPFCGIRLSGGAVGLLKSYRKERPELCAKTIDLDLEQPPTTLAAQIFTELSARGGRQEVGYPAGARTIFRTVRSPLSPAVPLQALRAGAVVLATGGARGITAEVLRELAHRDRTLILVGRRPLACEAPATTRLLSEASLRAHFIAVARAEGSSLARVGERVREVLSVREMSANLEDFRARGAQVEYHALDVTNEAALAELVADLRSRFGGIDGLVHGAGVIEDKKVAEKSSDSWQRVVDAKVLGLLCLQKHLPLERMQFLTVFSSVAGRYGNSGQADYATANELMNRICCDLTRAYPHLNVTSLCWGPWGPTLFGPGMVTPETAAKFAAMGVRLVTAEKGRRSFAEEVLRKPGQNVEVVLGEGPWEEREAEIGRWEQATPTTPPLRTEATPPSTETTPPSTKAALPSGAPLLTHGTLQTDSKGSQILSFRIDGSHDYLRDHVIDTKAVLPAAVALEMMAQGASLCWPRWRVTEIVQCRLLKGLEIDASELDGTGSAGKLCELVFAPAPYGSSEGFEVAVSLESSALENGRAPVHYTATVRLQLANGAEWSAPRPLREAASLDPAWAYENLLFHGPRFQVVSRIETLSSEGIGAAVQPSRPSTWLPKFTSDQDDSWKFDPALLDAAPQLAIVWCRQLHESTCLPVRFGRVLLPGDAASRQLTTRMIYLAKSPADPSLVLADVYYLDEQGRVTLVIEDLECIASTSLNRLARKEARELLQKGSPSP